MVNNLNKSPCLFRPNLRVLPVLFSPHHYLINNIKYYVHTTHVLSLFVNDQIVSCLFYHYIFSTNKLFLQLSFHPKFDKNYIFDIYSIVHKFWFCIVNNIYIPIIKYIFKIIFKPTFN